MDKQIKKINTIFLRQQIMNYFLEIVLYWLEIQI